MSNIYLITANGVGNFNQQLFHKFIANTLYPTHINSWWHYFAGPTYLVSSKLTENQLYTLLKGHMGSFHFLVIKVDPSTAQGWMPKDAWAWMGRVS
jgi:hypothetical protein